MWHNNCCIAGCPCSRRAVCIACIDRPPFFSFFPIMSARADCVLTYVRTTGSCLVEEAVICSKSCRLRDSRGEDASEACANPPYFTRYPHESATFNSYKQRILRILGNKVTVHFDGIILILVDIIPPSRVAKSL